MNDKELAEEIALRLPQTTAKGGNISLTDELWQQIIAALRRGPDLQALILRCRNCGSTNVEDAERPPSGEMVTERMVEVAAKWLSESPLIQEPKLPPPAWMGLARHILQAAAEASKEAK